MGVIPAWPEPALCSFELKNDKYSKGEPRKPEHCYNMATACCQITATLVGKHEVGRMPRIE